MANRLIAARGPGQAAGAGVSEQCCMQSRLVVGQDVPWVTAWSEETLEGARPCPTADGELAVHQTERPGWGRPIYSANHFRRQRESVAHMLCPMCGSPTAEGDRWTLTAKPTAAGVLRARGLGHLLPPELPDPSVVLDAGAVAPLHHACATRSSAECPHLRSDPKTLLRRFPERWAMAALWVEARPTAPATALLARAPPPTPVVSFLQLIGLTREVDRGWRQRL